MKSESITIVSKIDPKTFYRFAIFDTLKLRKRWISPAIFAGILLTSSLICFSMYSKAEHAEFLGMVLLVIALGVPGVYFGTFFYSLKTQAHALKLQKSRIAYTIELNQTGILVTSGTSNGSTVSYNWNELFGIYRQLGCIFLSNRHFFYQMVVEMLLTKKYGSLLLLICQRKNFIDNR